MKLLLTDIFKINFLEIVHPNGLNDIKFTGVSIDSRTIKKGELFVALRGKNYDGHNYLLNSCKNGASALLIEKKYFKKNENKLLRKSNINCPIIMVEDTLVAFGELANVYRKKFNIPIIAIAGSNGKTTTKEMIASILGTKYKVLANEGNLNNQIGVPLTLFRLNDQHQIAVLEIGTNNFGEIDYLCKILEPDYGLITNIGNEHLEFFKDLKGVAKEETSLFKYLEVKDYNSFAFVNADYNEIKKASNKIKNKVLYSLKNKNVDFKTDKLVENNGAFSFEIIDNKNGQRIPVNLKILGLHNVENALAAASVGITFGVPADKIKRTLEAFQPADKRMQIIKIGKTKIINDSYNANLNSTLNALQVFNSMKTKGKKIFVFGDMLELGKSSRADHIEIGKKFFSYAKKSLVPMHLITYGKETKHTYDAAGNVEKIHFKEKNAMLKYVAKLVNSNDLVLVKGSRAMKMEELIDTLTKKFRR